MLLVLLQEIVVSLAIVTIFQGNEIRTIQQDIPHTKFVQVAAVLNAKKHSLKKKMNNIKAKLKEGKRRIQKGRLENVISII